MCSQQIDGKPPFEDDTLPRYLSRPPNKSEDSLSIMPHQLVEDTGCLSFLTASHDSPSKTLSTMDMKLKIKISINMTK